MIPQQIFGIEPDALKAAAERMRALPTVTKKKYDDRDKTSVDQVILDALERPQTAKELAQELGLARQYVGLLLRELLLLGKVASDVRREVKVWRRV